MSMRESLAFYHSSGPVMGWLGMRPNHADDLDYPTFPEGHPLRRRVLYRLGSGPCAGGTWRPGSAARGRVGQATPDQPEMTTVLRPSRSLRVLRRAGATA